jgi:hypothetical protein
VTSPCAPIRALLALYVFDTCDWSAWGTILTRRSQRGGGVVLVPRQRTDGVVGSMIGVIFPVLPHLSSLVYILSNRGVGEGLKDYEPPRKIKLGVVHVLSLGYLTSIERTSASSFARSGVKLAPGCWFSQVTIWDR